MLGKVADGTRNGQPNDTCRCTPCFLAQLRPAQPDVNKVKTNEYLCTFCLGLSVQDTQEEPVTNSAVTGVPWKLDCQQKASRSETSSVSRE